MNRSSASLRPGIVSLSLVLLLLAPLATASVGLAADLSERQLLVRLAPEPIAPSPEALAARARAGDAFEGALAAGAPIDATPVIGDRPTGEARAAVVADPERPRARLLRWVLLTYPEGTDLDAVLEAMRADPAIEVAERNLPGTFSATTPNDPLFSTQWGSPSLNLPEAWDQTKGHGYVGLIDTGLDVDHPDLAVTFDATSYLGGNFRPHLSNDFANPATCATNPGGCVDEGEAGDGTNFNGRGHGTHVSGIVGATAGNGIGVAGNCWNCSIMMARSRITPAEVADALRWLADHGAQAASMSFGWPNVQTVIADAIDDVNERDLILVAAVGNDLSDIEFPSFDPDVISAGGTEEPAVPGTVDFWERDVCPLSGTIECGSNYTVTVGSPMIELVAPAADVMSTFYVGGSWNQPLGCWDGGHPASGYDVCTGTSMSSPGIASVATLVRSVNPLLSQADVRTILKDTASGGGVWDNQLGYGVPDTAAAVDEILGTAAGATLKNRLTPLFVLKSTTANAHLETTVPQRASAALEDTATPYFATTSIAPAVGGYGQFPGVRCVVGPCTQVPVAWSYLFTTDEPPFAGAPPLVPLYRLSYDEPWNGNPTNQSFAYTTEAVGVKRFTDLGYRLDGVEGYLYQRCTPEPSCIPTGATRLYRLYNLTLDDYVVVPESKVAFFQSQGYAFQPTLNDWIGYVYENLDADGDDLIDGFEGLIGTNAALGDTDGDGLDDGAEVLTYPYSDPLDAVAAGFEFGSVTVAQANSSTWTTVALSQSFSAPVVVMGPPSKNGGQPTTIRVRNVTPTSFQFQIDEWDYLDGGHIAETIGYLVVEAGTTSIGGLNVRAGAAKVGTAWKNVSFGGAFIGTPVVLAQVASANEAGAVTDRLRNITGSGFEVRIQEEEAADNVHGNEEVHFIAIQAGTTTAGGSTLLVDRTGNLVTEAFFAETFSTSVSNPVFVARAQTTDGGNTAALRHTGLTASGVQVQIEEEQSLDAEIAHTTEDIGYIVIGQ